MLTLLPIIGVLSVGFSIMSLIVIISLLTSLLLRYIADWDDKRVVLSKFYGANGSEFVKYPIKILRRAFIK